MLLEVGTILIYLYSVCCCVDVKGEKMYSVVWKTVDLYLVDENMFLTYYFLFYERNMSLI